MKKLGLLVACALFLISAVPVAAIGKPTREFLPAGPVIYNGVCDFPVSLEVIVNREYIKTFYDANGEVTHFIINGTSKLRLTNTVSGASIDINSSGPATGVPNADGTTTIVFRGHTTGFLFPTDAGGPGVILNFGQQVVTFGPTGAVLSVVSNGHATDICDLLGP